jgi:N-dimethylarginine dimethylaminohydrolase
MEVIPFEIDNEYLYHLDCSIFPITREEVLVCTEAAEESTLAAIERHASIIDVAVDNADSGMTNCMRIGDFVLCASNIEELSESDENYRYEKVKIQSLEEVCDKLRLTPVFFNLSEFMKSGAMLSCMVMHLNYHNF